MCGWRGLRRQVERPSATSQASDAIPGGDSIRSRLLSLRRDGHLLDCSVLGQAAQERSALLLSLRVRVRRQAREDLARSRHCDQRGAVRYRPGRRFGQTEIVSLVLFPTDAEDELIAPILAPPGTE